MDDTRSMTSRTSEVKVAAADGDDEDDDAVKVSSVFRLMCGFISYDLFEGRVITARARGPIADSPDFTRNHSRLISFYLCLRYASHTQSSLYPFPDEIIHAGYSYQGSSYFKCSSVPQIHFETLQPALKFKYLSGRFCETCGIHATS